MNAPGENPKSNDILQALMDPERVDLVPWTPAELRAMLDHQLATPLMSQADRLAELAGSSPAQIARWISDSDCRTFGDVLSRRPPPAELLDLVKGFARAAMSDGRDLPPQVARVLFVAASRPAS